MASSGNNEEYKWPNSGQDGPDVEWEHVPIEIPEIPGPIPEMAEIPTFPPISPGTEDQVPEDAGDETKEEEAKLPSVEDMKLEGAEGEDESPPLTPLPKIQVSTLERYYPSPEEVKQTYPDNLDELFDKHGDELIFQDDPNGKTMHIFFLYKKLYKCIRKGCKSTLVVEEIPETKTPKGKEEKEEAEEDPKEGGSKEDHKEKEDVKEEEKGAIPKKKRKPRKKKSNKKGKNKDPNGQVNPKEEPGKPEEKEK